MTKISGLDKLFTTESKRRFGSFCGSFGGGTNMEPSPLANSPVRTRARYMYLCPLLLSVGE